MIKDLDVPTEVGFHWHTR